MAHSFSASVVHSRGGLGTAGRRCRRGIGRRCRDGGIVRDSALSPRFATRNDVRSGTAPVRFRSGRRQPALVVDARAQIACRDGHIALASSRGASAGAGAAEGATCSLDVAEDVAKIEEPVVNARSLKKIIPLGIIFFFCLFNYTILRDTKDVLVVTAPNSGAEAIPFLKTWVNLPFAIACMLLYTRAGATLGSEALFYASVTPFLAFFFLFAFAIYPNASTLHPIDWADWLITKAGPAFKGPIGIVRNWTYALFYVMAEMWGSVVVSLGFWSFANQITSVREAKVFYPLFGLGANVSLVISGYAVKYFSQIRANLPPGADPWDVSLKALMSLVAIGGVIMLATNWYMYRTVLRDPEGGSASGEAGEKKKKKKKKPKMSMGDGIRMLSQNSYIKDLGALVLGYGMAINICEVTWKAGLKKAFPNPNDYSAFMGNFSSVTGVATLVMMFVGKFMLSRFGWRPAALVTPIVVLVSGLGFFGLLMYSTAITAAGSAGATICGFAPLTLAVFIGAAQNIFSKSAKYSLFDPCKEMAYIPLDDETRLRGKAAIDVVAARGGKSGGAFIQQLLIIAFGSLSASTPVLALLLLLVCGQWIKSTLSLASQFQDMERDDTASKLMPAKARPACSAWAPPPVGFETWTRYRYVAVVDDETGNIKTSYVPYTEFPADYLERITSDTAIPVQSLTS